MWFNICTETWGCSMYQSPKLQPVPIFCAHLLMSTFRGWIWQSPVITELWSWKTSLSLRVTSEEKPQRSRLTLVTTGLSKGEVKIPMQRFVAVLVAA